MEAELSQLSTWEPRLARSTRLAQRTLPCRRPHKKTPDGVRIGIRIERKKDFLRARGLYKMNGGRRPTRDEGRGTANQNKQRRGKHPHLSRRGTIQITMNNIIHIPTGRGGLRRGGNEIIRERFP